MLVVQCVYCFHLKASNGDFHDFGIWEKLVRFIAAKNQEISLVSHGVCPECFERVKNSHVTAMAREGGLKAQNLPVATP